MFTIIYYKYRICELEKQTLKKLNENMKTPDQGFKLISFKIFLAHIFHLPNILHLFINIALFSYFQKS